MARFDPFHEIQLPANYSWKAKNGSMSNTSLMKMDSRFEDRHENWKQERGVFDISQTIKTIPQAQALLLFFYCRYGRAIGFRFKDWNDYQAVTQPIGGGPDFFGTKGKATNTTALTMSRTANVALLKTVDPNYLSVGQVFQIAGASDSSFNGPQTVLQVLEDDTVTFKSFGNNTSGVTGGTVSGNPYQMGKFYQDLGGAFFRIINKPCSGLVTDATGYTPPVPQIFDNAVLQTTPTNYTLDVKTGLVTFTADSGLGPPNGDLLTWTGDFDTPARFDSDIASILMKQNNDVEWNNMLVVGLLP